MNSEVGLSRSDRKRFWYGGRVGRLALRSN